MLFRSSSGNGSTLIFNGSNVSDNFDFITDVPTTFGNWGAGDELRINAGQGEDIITTWNTATYVDGGDGMDNITGGAGSDTMYGQADGDTLSGGSGTDYLYGGDGGDTLFGGDGADQMYGDEIAGSQYSDTFHYLASSNVGDTIMDFNSIADSDSVDDVLNFDAVGFGISGDVFGTDWDLVNESFNGNSTANMTAGKGTFIYDATDDKLYFDADGTDVGSGMFIAFLTDVTTLSEDNIDIDTINI